MSPNEQHLNLSAKENSARELSGVAQLRAALRRFEARSQEVTNRHALTPRQYDLLALLHDPTSASNSTTSLATALHLSRNSMSELISRAVRAGLLVRTSDQTDARVKPLKPTALGTKRFLAAVTDLRPARAELTEILRAAAKHARAIGPDG